jgi:hypothetical protein
MVKKAKPSRGRGRKIIYSVAVALITVFFVAYATQTLYSAPRYEDYCDLSRPFDYQNASSCVAEGGVWVMPEVTASLVLSCDQKQAGSQYTCIPVTDYQKYTGYCNIGERQCDKDFRAASEPYNRNVFVTHVIVGLLVLIAAFFISIEPVSLGLMGGGAIVIVFGAMRYWSELSDVLRTVFLGLALGILIYFGYKKLR